MTFIEQSALDIRRKLQYVDGILGMSPSQLVDIAFKVYNAWEAWKTKQSSVFLEMGWGGQRKRQDPIERRRDSLGISQCAYCREGGHWRDECPKRKRENRNESPR